MVPEGWLHTTFDRHIDCLTGYAFKSESYTNDKSGYKLLRGDNIEPGKLRWIDEKYWPKEQSKILDKYQLEEGDFVIALDRTWISAGLKVAEIKADDIPCLLVQRVARVRANSSLEQALLRQYFSGNKFEQYVKSVQTATAVPHISPNDIKNFSLLLPPIEEQKKIAQILSTWDKAIATTEKLLENSQKQKQALMQQLLTGKKRFSGFSGEWNKVPLGKVAEMNSGGTPKSSVSEFYGGGIPWVSIADMTSKGKWISSTQTTLSKAGLENSSARIYPENTVLYAMYASIGECSIAKVPLSSSQAILGIRPNEQLHYEYLYFYLSSLKEKIKLQGQQGTQANLNAGMVKEFLIPLPKIQEQKAISNVLNIADEQVNLITNMLSNLQNEKKALMQQLLTGKRRVKVDL